MDAALGTWGPIIVMVAIFYFLLYRPQKKAQQRRREMLESLKVGNEVITAGGIYGTLVAVREKDVTLKVAEHVDITVARSSISTNITAQKSLDEGK